MTKSNGQLKLSDIVSGIKNGDRRSQGILYTYLKDSCYLKINHYLLNTGGTKEDAEDCFQQAVMVLFNAIKKNKFGLKALSFRSNTSQLCAFIMAVCKNLWRKELRWRSRVPLPRNDQIGTTILVVDISKSVIAKAYMKMGEACKKVISLYYQEKLSATKIARSLGEETETIKKRLESCSSQLIKIVGSALGDGEQEKLMELLHQGMDDLGERCQVILKSFYIEQLSMAEIAIKLNYANAHTVTEQKSRCMKKLNEAIVNRMLNKNSTNI